MATIRRTPISAIPKLLLGAALAITLAACSSGGGDRDAAVDSLVESGMTEDEASCIVDALEDSIGVDNLADKVSADEAGELSEEESQAILEAAFSCAGLDG